MPDERLSVANVVPLDRNQRAGVSVDPARMTTVVTTGTAIDSRIARRNRKNNISRVESPSVPREIYLALDEKDNAAMELADKSDEIQDITENESER